MRKESLLINSFENPVAMGVIRKAKERITGDLNIPLNLLPALITVPPVAREGKGALCFRNRTALWAIKECKGLGEPPFGMGCNMDGKSGPESA